MSTHSAGLVEAVGRQHAHVGVEAAHGNDHALVHGRRLQARGRGAPLLPVLRLSGRGVRIRQRPPLQEPPPCASAPLQAQMLFWILYRSYAEAVVPPVVAHAPVAQSWQGVMCASVLCMLKQHNLWGVPSHRGWATPGFEADGSTIALTKAWVRCLARIAVSPCKESSAWMLTCCTVALLVHGCTNTCCTEESQLRYSAWCMHVEVNQEVGFFRSVSGQLGSVPRFCSQNNGSRAALAGQVCCGKLLRSM